MRKIVEFLKSNLWLIPSFIVFSLMSLAYVLIGFSQSHPHDEIVERWPWIFSAGADGARAMLSAIAGSVITVAGVAFSITIVVLSLASNQYSPRVLRNFISDWRSQAVLGGFLGIYAYCLLVLRTVRGEGSDQFVPAVAVFGSVVLAITGVALLIYFIHHVAVSIRASNIIQSVFAETISAIESIYPEQLSSAKDEDFVYRQTPDATWRPILSPGTGYMQSLNCDAISKCAKKNSVVIRFFKRPGDFVVEGVPIAYCSKAPTAEFQNKICSSISVGKVRTLEQDVSFGICQLVDVALKGLSPGINDVTTAIIAIDYLGAILARLSNRKIVSNSLVDSEGYGLIPKDFSYQEFINQCFDQIRQNGLKTPVVLLSLLMAIEASLVSTQSRSRQGLLREQVKIIVQLAQQNILEVDQPSILDTARRIMKIAEAESFLENVATADCEVSSRRTVLT